VEFEFDPEKSRSNLAKHGIDFIDAQRLWSGRPVEWRLPHAGEDRFLRLGVLYDRVWVAIFTWRAGKVRLISVRGARRSGNMNEKSVPSEGTITSLDGTRTITVEEFDRLFDDASDEIDQFIDWSSARGVGNGVEYRIGRKRNDPGAAASAARDAAE